VTTFVFGREMKRLALHIVCAVVCSVAFAGELNVAGDVMLFDFENPSAPAHCRSDGDLSVKLSSEYAHSGRHSLAVRLHPWNDGEYEYPGVRIHLPPGRGDWSFHGVLEAWVFLPEPIEHFYLEIIDAHGTKYFRHPSAEPIGKWLRIRVDLSNLGGDREHIDHIYFFSLRPSKDVVFFIDDVRLLKPGDAWIQEQLDKLDRATRNLERFLQAQHSRDDRRSGRVLSRVLAVRGRAERIAERAAGSYSGGIYPLSRAQRDRDMLRSQWRRIHRYGRRYLVERAEETSQKEGAPHGLSVWLADSMTKVLPRDVFSAGDFSLSESLALARREYESFQVCVASRRSLSNVRVVTSDLRSAGGAVFPREHISAHPVGFVKTHFPQNYKADYTGWWPDPILTFLDAVNVRARDFQPFWVTVHADEDQPAGTYTGKLQLVADDIAAVPIALRVRVYPFAIPQEPSLPTAITVRVPEHDKARFFDFLRAYKIMPDDIYRRQPPPIDDLKLLQRTGWVGRFNLLQMHRLLATFERDRRMAEVRMNIALIQRVEPELKQMGLWAKAYVYGFDEVSGEAAWSAMQEAFGTLKRRFPDLMTLTTAHDPTYGLESGVDAVDAWCPRTSGYDPEWAQAARARGKQVWWYICVGPRHPYANWFVEYPAIETRLLMGAMAAKYRPDGFLYWYANNWPSKPIDEGPYTDWDTAWKDNNGDGQLFANGVNGPLPTIRLENFRDGLEDYEYYIFLERLGGDASVSPDVVRSLSDYTRDPRTLYRERERIASEIIKTLSGRREASVAREPRP